MLVVFPYVPTGWAHVKGETELLAPIEGDRSLIGLIQQSRVFFPVWGLFVDFSAHRILTLQIQFNSMLIKTQTQRKLETLERPQ